MDKKYFEEIYNRHVDTVFKIAIVYLKNQVDAEEVVQETFIKLLNTNKEFNDHNHEKAWLITVASNHCKNILKHSWFKRVVCVDELSQYTTDDIQLGIIEDVLNLPYKYKSVIYLYYYEGYSINEISKILDLKVSTVKSNLHRGRKLLKIKLEEV